MPRESKAVAAIVEQNVRAELNRQSSARSVPLDALPQDRYVTTRVTVVHGDVVQAYAEAMTAQPGAPWQIVDVFEDTDGGYWLADGVHRVEAAKLNGAASVLAFVQQGNRLDALKHAAGANSAHGLQPTAGDKRNAVRLLLAALPDADTIPREALATLAKCSHWLVDEVRKELAPKDQPRPKRLGKDGKARRLPVRKAKSEPAVIDTTAEDAPTTSHDPAQPEAAAAVASAAIEVEPVGTNAAHVAAYLATIRSLPLTQRFHIKFFVEALAEQFPMPKAAAERLEAGIADLLFPPSVKKAKVSNGAADA